MRNWTFFLLLIFLLNINSLGCTNNKEIEQYQSRIVQLEKENIELKEKIDRLNSESNISIVYQDYNYKKRFIPKESRILALPYNDALVFNKISPNTVVKVIDAAMCENNLWLYIEIPVYDSPINYKGWILESNTEVLTEANIKKVQSDLTVPKGKYIYEVFEFDKIKTTQPILLEQEIRGRLEEKQDYWLRLSCPGGSDIWVKQQDILYPTIE